jgi:hypothetical protein
MMVSSVSANAGVENGKKATSSRSGLNFFIRTSPGNGNIQ